MGGLAYDAPSSTSGKGSTSQRWFLRPEAFKYLTSADLGYSPQDLDCIILEDSKADTLAQAISVLQCIWFLTQYCGRKMASLPITILELYTLGIVLCCSVTYAFWYWKPHGIQRSTLILGQNLLDVENTIRIKSSTSAPRIVLADHRPYQFDISDWRSLTMVNIVGTVYGFFHLQAWNFQFPTVVEQYLWRISSLGVILGCPLAMALALTTWKYSRFIDFRWRDWWVVITKSATLLAVGLYMVARLFLIVEAFLSLRVVPVGVYSKVEWTSYLPHI